jgi:enoyl-CoA hydratase/carnithine racemase
MSNFVRRALSGAPNLALSDSVHVLNNGSSKTMILNRPKMLNSLNQDMCIQITNYLGEWHERGNVSSFLMKGAGEKAFCAGMYFDWSNSI